MSYYVIIRGPAASGKSTIAKRLAKELSAYYINFDSVLANHNLDIIEGDGISTENFIKGNNLILNEIKERLTSGQIVIIDACFYRRGHIEHLIKNLPYKHFIFSLKTSLKECIRRNESRGKKMTKKDIRDVFNLVSQLEIGISTEGETVDDIIKEIRDCINQKSD
jgi:predicted kinase